jgi:hypothetical protein
MVISLVTVRCNHGPFQAAYRSYAPKQFRQDGCAPVAEVSAAALDEMSGNQGTQFNR